MVTNWGTPVMFLKDVKVWLRNGPHTEIGCYPVYFVASDGEPLSFKAVRKNWREVVYAHLTAYRRSDWHIAGVDINYEDPALFCAHTNERIPSAYAEDEVIE